MQLAARIRARDLEDFFSAVGKVRRCFCVVFLINLVYRPTSTLKLTSCDALCPAGEGRQNDLGQKLQEVEGYRLHRVCGLVFGSIGHWTDGPEAVRSAHHSPGLPGNGKLILLHTFSSHHDFQIIIQHYAFQSRLNVLCALHVAGREEPSCSGRQQPPERQLGADATLRRIAALQHHWGDAARNLWAFWQGQKQLCFHSSILLWSLGIWPDVLFL